MSESAKAVDQYVVAFVDQDGKVVGYINRDRIRPGVTSLRECAREFDGGDFRIGLSAATALLEKGDVQFLGHEVKIELKELWEMANEGRA